MDVDRYAPVPSELKELGQWVGFRLDPPRKENGKPTKVPVNPKTGRNASVNVSTTWGCYEQAVAAMPEHGLDGIGIVFTAEDGLVGVDIDKCRNAETGEIADWALKRIEQLATYTEVSPSGTGVHCICRGTLPPGGRRKGKLEMYESGRYFTVTGQHVEGAPSIVEERTPQLAKVHAEVFGKPKPPRGPSSPHLDDDEIIARAKQKNPKFAPLWNGDHSAYESQSEADLALCGMLAFWSGGNAQLIDRLFRQSGLMRDKWDEFRGQTTYGEKTIARALEGKTEFYRPGVRPVPVSAGTFDHDGQLTDSGNAERLRIKYGKDLRYCYEWKKFLVWDGKRWRSDTIKDVNLWTKYIARQLYREAASTNDHDRQEAIAKWAHKSEEAARRKAMVELVRCEPGIPIDTDDLDRDPFLLNCRNGTVNLRTGELHKHRREDYLTKIAPVAFDPHARSELWEEFLTTVLPDDEIRQCVQRAAGYSLTGDVSEQVLFLLHGEGANGKSSFLLAMQSALGKDYAIQAAPELLLSRADREHPTQVAALFRARMAVCTETGKGRAFNEVLVKQLTGGDLITARRMREDFWQFAPTHKLWLGTNHLPAVRGTEHAIWRRIRVIPFTAKIPKIDKQFIAKLKREGAAVLAWAVRGALLWQEQGLDAPESVQRATDAYRCEMDVIGGFLADWCTVSAGLRIGATDLFGHYGQWCRETGHAAVNQHEFGRSMTERGIEKRKSGGTYRYVGIGLTADASHDGDHWGRSGPRSDMNDHSSPHVEGLSEQGPEGPQWSPSSAEGIGRGGSEDTDEEAVA